MRIPRPKTLVIIAAVLVAMLVAAFVEAPPRRLLPDERIPERIVIRMHPKFGGREFIALTNRQEILRVMTALPSAYTGPYCACFGYYHLEFYAPTGMYRTVSYKPGFIEGYVRDTAQPTGQSSVPRRFKRIVGRFIAEHERI
jgi:hypothetical protein